MFKIIWEVLPSHWPKVISELIRARVCSKDIFVSVTVRLQIAGYQHLDRFQLGMPSEKSYLRCIRSQQHVDYFTLQSIQIRSDGPRPTSKSSQILPRCQLIILVSKFLTKFHIVGDS